MNYEEKYNQALSRARESYRKSIEQGWTCDKEIYEQIFPELRESEDERIREEIIQFLKLPHPPFVDISKRNYEEWIAWLEKQGEQNPADKVESKFNVGDWITNGEYTWKVTDIKPLDYILQSPNGDVVDDAISYVDEHFHLWTIQDAKDGDVLYSHNSNLLWIYKDKTKYYVSMILDYAQYNCISINCDIVIFLDTCPATKEQRDLLFQKMKEAGYEWDTEKKELKKAESKSAVWSEEDEEKLNSIIEVLCDNSLLVQWLKSIKPQNRWKPSNKQLTALKNAIIGKRGPLYDLYFDLEKL